MAAQAPQVQPITVEQQVVDIVRELLLQQGKERAAASLKPSSQFERDLGLASLDLVELMVRCETKLEIELPDGIAEQADTPSGWAKAIEQGTQEQTAKSAYRIVAPAGDLPPEPKHAITLADVLSWHAEIDPGRIHVHFLEEGNGRGLTCTQLFDSAEAVARGLVAAGLERGSPVALLVPNSEDFLDSFFGVMLAGGVPMPIYPPTDLARLYDYVEGQGRLLEAAGARFLVVSEIGRTLGRLLRVRAPKLTGVATANSLRASGRRTHRRLPGPVDTALLQLTSGSTGEPKAIPLTHANLLANLRTIGRRVDVNGRDSVVSWFPLASDAGLVGCWLFSLYHGVPLTLLSPKEFIERPESWLWGIHDSRGTLSAAPNYAYELCARRVPMSAVEGMDLTSWRLAVNAGEPVQRETVERFIRRFSSAGFQRAAMSPAYGLAEATVALSIPEPGLGPRLTKEGFYKLGRPLDGMEVRSVDGRIQFRGPCQSSASRGKDGWTDSGDMGYVEDDEVVFTSRSKDVIVRQGRTLSPQIIEEAASLATGVRPATATAIGIPDKSTGTERLVVVAESLADNERDRARVADEIKHRIEAAVGEAPDEAIIIAKGTIPRTLNGKLRRQVAAAQYRTGTLGEGPRPPELEMLVLWRRNFAGMARIAAARASRALYQRTRFNNARAVARFGGAMISLFRKPEWTNAFARLALKYAGREPRFEGALPAAGCLLVANRCGHPDPVAIAAALRRRVTFAGNESLIGVLEASRLLMQHSIARTHDAMQAALKRGDVLVLFPDSPIGTSAERSRFHLAALRAAQSVNAPIVPAALDEFRLRTTARAGEPIDSRGDAIELRSRIRAAIAKLYV